MGQAHSGNRRANEADLRGDEQPHRGKAPAAIILETMISGEKAEVPDVLLKTYPKELQPYARR